MRGSIIKRSRRSWALVVELDRTPDGKRRQKWVTFAVPPDVSQREATKQAEGKLAELLRDIHRGEFTEPSSLTVLAWLRRWRENLKGLRRPLTDRTYRFVIEHHVAHAPLAAVPLQKLRASDLERYYASLTTLAPSSVALHHSVIRAALGRAVRDRILSRNVACDGVERPTRSKDHAGARACWTAAEARAFLTHAKAAGAQEAAFYALALDTGARRGELAGLTWDRVHLDAGRITIDRQIIGDDGDRRAVFGPTKSGRTHDVTIAAETIALLRTHKAQQAALKLKHRTSYDDAGLVFAKELPDLQRPGMRLGQPLADRLWVRDFHRLAEAAGVRRITFHGMRHTAATLLLQAGTSIRVVADRLGHAKVSMTLDVYAHALPDAQQAAAERMSALLHGAG
jgi:integrase